MCFVCAKTYSFECDAGKEPNRSVIRLDLGGHSASGVIVEKNTILTVLHAIAANGKIIANINGKRDAKLIAAHEGLDLALLSSDTGSLPPITLTSEKPKVSETVWAVGFGGKIKQEVTIGNFIKQKIKGIISSARINPGSSGGGLLLCGKNGFELLGLIKSYQANFRNGKLVNSGSSVSVPAQDIKKFIQSVTSQESTILYSNL